MFKSLSHNLKFSLIFRFSWFRFGFNIGVFFLVVAVLLDWPPRQPSTSSQVVRGSDSRGSSHVRSKHFQI
ncbi:hypothetical protein RchiOBHm_Chr3g0476501 [Rosa chinensis]|uniref:Transmembrane protein n=1 Tax=Rosa chinensis TaxID=74649 RepID=A0A2P6RCP1_ROSCH|nr:hypothetical protein RchiOBHm_Chr3g0476501 [Rosa chinensis]